MLQYHDQLQNLNSGSQLKSTIPPHGPIVALHKTVAFDKTNVTLHELVALDKITISLHKRWNPI